MNLIYMVIKLYSVCVCVCVCVCSLVPRPHPAFIACSTEKWGEPGIFSHVSDITTNEKLMNVGGLKLNGVIAHAL